jgi:TM2 domain-containing membrane protein YozV
MKNRNILKIHIGLLVLFISFEILGFAQSPGRCDKKFIDHLVNAGDFEEALYLLDSTGCFSEQLNDTISYLRGWSLYSVKRLIPSSESLVKVSSDSPFYFKSHFFAGYGFAHTGNYNSALDVFSNIDVNNEKMGSLKNYEIAGVYLLQGNINMYEKSLSLINKSQYEISDSYDNLNKIVADLKMHKRKSPLVAGVLSGIVPGSGKFYAGKKGEAISALIASVGLGLVTWENYRKNGLKSFKTIAFGTAFAFSYAANIYGAVMTVSILETEYKNNVKNSILFNLHIPLRNTFDK